MLRVSQIVIDGEGWIALIRDSQVIGKFTNWKDAREAYRKAKK